MQTSLKRIDFEDFLIRLYFGEYEDAMKACCRRAYLDFNRTLHGVGDRGDSIYQHVEPILGQQLEIIRLLETPNQEKFDRWHRDASAVLSAAYNECGYSRFRIGQAQKWLNMTLKYIFTFGESRIPSFSQLYSFCHVPLDKILINRLSDTTFPKLSSAWSRLNDYDEYLRMQQWFRAEYTIPPLDAEFHLWMRQSYRLSKQT